MRTLKDLAPSTDMIEVATVIEFDVEALHQQWDGLVPIHKEARCTAGKAIRSAMHTYENTRADLTPTERAI